MPRTPSLPLKASRLLPLLCALPEEAQCALLALLRWQQSASADLQIEPAGAVEPLPLRRVDGEQACSDEVVQVASAHVVHALIQRVEALEEELLSLRDRVADTGPRLLTKKAFLREYPDLYSKSGLDKVLFLKEDNGLSEFEAIHQRAKGCRVLIDPKKFLEWYRWFHAHG